jgi:hypothetical protein
MPDLSGVLSNNAVLDIVPGLFRQAIPEGFPDLDLVLGMGDWQQIIGRPGRFTAAVNFEPVFGKAPDIILYIPAPSSDIGHIFGLGQEIPVLAERILGELSLGYVQAHGYYVSLALQVYGFSRKQDVPFLTGTGPPTLLFILK